MGDYNELSGWAQCDQKDTYKGKRGAQSSELKMWGGSIAGWDCWIRAIAGECRRM